MPPEQVTPAVVAQAQQALADASGFGFQLARVGRFPGVAYLTPEPAAPFVDLTQRLVRSFPAYLPYGGEHAGVVPHLTVAHGTPEEAASAEAELSGALRSRGPISCTCTQVVLIENASGRWQEMHAFGLQPVRTPDRT